VIVVVPAPIAVATPEALIVATAVFEEVQVVLAVTSPTEPSLYVAVAWYCCVAPTVTLRFAGLTAIEETVAAFAVTVSDALPLTPLTTAVMVADPAATPFTRPFPSTVATEELEVAQPAAELTSPVVPSL
jgi:hypothetical protein